MSPLFNQQCMQLQIFGLLVCLANLFSVLFTTCGFSSSLKKCCYLKWPISNCCGLIAWIHKGLCWPLFFSGHVQKNGYLSTDFSRRGRNFTACFSLTAMNVSSFTITFLEWLPSWEEFPFHAISVGDLYKDTALPYLSCLVLCLKCAISWAKCAADGFRKVFDSSLCDNNSTSISWRDFKLNNSFSWDL